MATKYNNAMFTTTAPELEEDYRNENPEELHLQNQIDNYNAEKETLRNLEIELIKYERKSNNP